uniref:TNFR-Cys domain-containing protein n=1 Tax=Oncorhynchus mykiss TaxID=8022 RepID=A0A8C7NIG3_ONCMY
MLLTLRGLPSEQYFLLGFHFVLVFGKDCGPAEYKTNDGQCCPMCNKGLVVRRDCTLVFSTSCMPCIRGTFMNEANGLTKCFPCSPCDPGQGLFTQTECKPTSNTVCDVLDGYYCRSYSSNSECSLAVEHTHCSPGQSTKSPGTKTTDTMCEECQHGFYSQHGVNCTAWTDCKAIGQYKTEDGSQTRDVVCGKSEESLRNRAIVLVPSSVLLFVVFIFVLFVTKGKETKENQLSPKLPVEETGFHERSPVAVEELHSETIPQL